MSEGGVSDDVCVPDAVSPAQFHEMWTGTGERSAEFKLALAVLEQALEDLTKHRTASDNERQRLYRHAETWLLSNDRRWPYSFVNVCDMLNVSSDRIRDFVVNRWVLGVERAMPAGDAPCSEMNAFVRALA